MATTVKNKALLSNMKDCTDDETLLIHTNGENKIFHRQGDLNIVPMIVHSYPMFLANIILMKDVRKITGIRIMMDTLE